MHVQVLLAWPDHYVSKDLDLAAGATVAEAVAAAALPGSEQVDAIAVHGVIARPQQVLQEGDRVELLRPLLADPKEARRRRATPAARRG